ncbi:MAG: hypothetical protein GKR89_18920 [Candidatus Latescibacteria bacterium]|nr:hypothetical protein [Candidatus Latescibacterota bacterium]
MRYPLALVCLLLARAATAQDDLPHHTIRHSAGPIVLDGRLDEASWQAAEIIDQFTFPWWSEGAKDRTEARLLWDQTALYVAFTAYDPHISATLTQRDSPVSRDDCVEVFIAPDSSRVTTYFNFEFNALGTILDRSPRDKRSKKWNGEGVKIALDIQGTLNNETDRDSLWVAEIALPFAVFAPYAPNLPPADGDTWRLNLYRTGGQVNLQYITWSDTRVPKPQFHAPERFGVVHFSARPVDQAD